MNGTFLPDTETTEFESRVYLNPETSLGEQNSFVDNYRDTVKQNTNQITTQTRNLGTDVSSNLGGLTGGTGYWTSRYQTPQTNTAIADLRATAQAQALNTVLSNEKAKWQKRYDDAYKAYQKRQNAKSNGSGTNLGDMLKALGIDTNQNDGNNTVDENGGAQGNVQPNTSGVSDYRNPTTGESYSVVSPLEFDANVITNSFYGRNPSDGQVIKVNGKQFVYDNGTSMWYEIISSEGD